MLAGILGNRCPSCREGKVFIGVYKMNVRCPSCGLVFNKEPGYFMGSLVAAYFIGAFSTIPTLVICMFILKMEIMPAIAIACVQLVLMNPFLFRYSRLIWLYSEARISKILDHPKP